MQHTKRYGIVFDKWSIYGNHRDITEYDTIEEVNEEIVLIEEMYRDTPRPKPKYSKYSYDSKNICVASNYIWSAGYIGEAFWGYLVVDFEEERIIKWGNDCLRTYNKKSDIREIKDWLFRGEKEVPKDYVWKTGEYQGWLQYRWGNGKNAIKYGDNAVVETLDRQNKVQSWCVGQCKRVRKKKKVITKGYNQDEELYLDELNAEILAKVETEKILS
jgi:hypothetical protein